MAQAGAQVENVGGAQGLLVAIVESSQDAIISKTLDGIVTSWNPGAERLFGYSAGEAIGRSISFLIPSAQRTQEDEFIARLRHGERIPPTEVVRLHKGGHEIVVSLSISPVHAPDGTIIGASKVARDISDRREMEKAREQLRQSQKMEAIGQLTGGIAHDFNNLLAVVLGNLDFMVERTDEDDPLREFIRPSIEAAEHGAQLTQQLLAFGRKQALQPRIVSVNELLHYFTTLVRHTLGPRVETILDLEPDLWNVHIDASQLQNALLNLAVNARDAMPDGGTLTFATSNEVLDEKSTEENEDMVVGEYVLITVADTGEGMRPEVLAKVFEPFFTTKEVGKGSGLGLSMVYGFVKQSAGCVRIESEYGKGTTVRIYVPRALGDAEVHEDAQVDAVIHAAGRAVILIVEDNKEVLKLTSTMVESLGYRVLTALSGDAALSLLRSCRDIDLLFTDIMLPGLYNGPELVRLALAANPSLKVLYCSGYPEHVIRQRGMLESGMNLIAKPFRKHELAEQLARVLANRQQEPA